jgi:hypothetical protein
MGFDVVMRWTIGRCMICLQGNFTNKNARREEAGVFEKQGNGTCLAFRRRENR